ncbi:Arginine--tRNA ligase [Thalassoglobus neptunius]|uniref:Arginine--tRNA ligase n=1 Tax=Thalassoglobus neptunius TaxID=1938619 RepID=A0A5C5WZR3_9PLAN|nr:arginine--tRNA ligase [Thalassoglobus neptunius]TWT55789.1 Arginine--tRNA ligase [Thalassoglobus neptunius]
MNILHELQSRFAAALADLTDNPEPFAAMVRPSQDGKFGDFQANCAMPMAKQNGVNPRELALKICERLNVSDLVEPPEVAGPGFINLQLKDDFLLAEVQRSFSDERLGVARVNTPKDIVLDFSSPNVAKPMHVGHLRSSVIGDALQRTLKFLGHRVISDNHTGDWGTQFGMIIYGYKNFVDSAAYEKDPVAELARLYRLVNSLSEYHSAVSGLPGLEERLKAAKSELLFNEGNADPADKKAKKALKKQRSEVQSLESKIEGQRAKIASVESDPELKALADAHPGIARSARDETARLHAGDPENLRLWKEFVPECVESLNRVYERLDVHFDKTLGESAYQPLLSDVVADLKAKGLAKESDGAICVFIPGNAAPFIVQKADGAFTYATTDLATVQFRVREFDANSMLYVVDARQSEHFKLLFETVRLWLGVEVELVHVSFGTVMGDDRKPFKTRSGDTVGLESLLDEAVSKAREIVASNDDSKTDEDGRPTPELDESTRDEISQIVGIGGIKYADLHHNRESDYVFDWDKMLAKTGDTATYMQYAYARIQGIFRRGEVDVEALRQHDTPILIEEPAERSLVLKLLRFEEALDAMASEYRPNILTQYLFELAGELTTFYDRCPVLKAEEERVRTSRLKLIDFAGRVIRQGLDLLGIQVCDRM